jgi:hypothetical protein
MRSTQKYEQVSNDLMPYGIGGDSLCLLNTPANRFRYRDIGVSSFNFKKTPISAVLENDKGGRRPLLYILHAASLSIPFQSVDIEFICRKLASRSETAYLAVLKDGSLTLYPCLLQNSHKHMMTLTPSEKSVSLLQEVIEGSPSTNSFISTAQKAFKNEAVRDEMRRIICTAGEGVYNSIVQAEDGKLTDEKRERIITGTLSLVGRALFARFLNDRRLIPSHVGKRFNLTHETPSGGFDSIHSAAHLCAWLDTTFNGDFLPILTDDTDWSNYTSGEKESQLVGKYISFFNSLPSSSEALQNLNKIMVGSETNDQFFLLRLLDFSHIPVGLLSEIYEDFAHKFSKNKAAKDSVHFTPRFLVELMVDEAFDGLPPSERSSAHILDPAVGAGIFLVFSLRRLAYEHYVRFGELNSNTIRQLLYSNLKGLDKNLHALSLAGLALYLTAIELDQTDDINNLCFPESLIGSVLIHTEDKSTDGLGSLSPALDDHFDYKFDIVIGNPPWTSLAKSEQLQQQALVIGQRVFQDRLKEAKNDAQKKRLLSRIKKLSGKNFAPDNNPEIPFVWRALEWAKPGGVVAFALHARLLFGKLYSQARPTLLEGCRTTAIVNGTFLRGTKVWPKINVPFCLFFARNELTGAEHGFRLLTPHVEKKLNEQGLLRLDPAKAAYVDIDEIEANPDYFKILSVGSQLDVNVFQKIKTGNGRGTSSIQAWTKGSNIFFRQGYIVGDESDSRSLASLRALNARHLIDEPELPLFLDATTLELFNESEPDWSQWPREPGCYKPPMLIQRMRFDEEPSFHLGPENLIYHRNYLGFSAHEAKDAFRKLTYLYTILCSNLFRYYVVLASGRMGVTWSAPGQKDIKNFPIIPFERLSENEKSSLGKDNSNNFLGQCNRDVRERWLTKLYGLSLADMQVIQDTLKSIPLKGKEKEWAEESPSPKQIELFNGMIKRELDQVFALYKVKQNVTISNVINRSNGAWIFVDISFAKESEEPPDYLQRLCEQLSEQNGSSRILIRMENGGIRLGQLNQNRYWTLSQARLCSYDLIREIDMNFEKWGIVQ